jgi:hypothetical protein
MAEQEFWRCTPRKLWALLDVHSDLHGGEQKEKIQMGYIDQVL